MPFAQGQPKRRVHPQAIGVIAILIACRNLIDSLPEQFEQGVIRMASRSGVINSRGGSIQDAEAPIDLPHDKKARIGSHLCAPKINADGAVEFRPDGPCLFVTNRAHKLSPSLDEFGA
jgi:hypothetical protein